MTRAFRLRGPSLALVCLAFALVREGALARGVAVRALVATGVTGRAQSVMPTALWKRYVEAYVGGDVVPFEGDGVPTLADCRAAKAELLVYAPFDLRARLPGLANATGDRVAAGAHIVAQNCITDETVFDRIVSFASDPPGDDNAGDFEIDPEAAWGHEVPQTLARVRFDRTDLARVSPPLPPDVVVASPAPARPANPTARVAVATPGPSQTPPATGSRSGRRSATPASTTGPSSTTAATPAAPSAARATIADIASRPYVSATPAPRPPNVIARVATDAVGTNVGPSDGVTHLSQTIAIARILSVRAPFAIVELRNSDVAAGDTLLDFADGDRRRLTNAIALTVTQNFGSYVEAVFDDVSGSPIPNKGDLIESR